MKQKEKCTLVDNKVSLQDDSNRKTTRRPSKIERRYSDSCQTDLFEETRDGIASANNDFPFDIPDFLRGDRRIAKPKSLNHHSELSTAERIIPSGEIPSGGLLVKLAGVSFGRAQENIRMFGCKRIGTYALVREPGNKSDPNAIQVTIGEFFMGYIPRSLAAVLAPQMDAGKRFIAFFVRQNAHPDGGYIGLTVKIVQLPCDEPKKA